ncbi:CvpA family protein [Candidatus Schneideria nysicola]|uniref:CvpA family protein n=1 Tax=Candidatus Schneideria nysicola TaxID=1081631 RepID=UPI001CAA4795|nr:CvpA family protein [Candidatus Schneideria nysicola]UAJ65076.1 CvpA family protein [Candidatus Schneideria nysicola]UAJ65609.1 CvpA family protein [Candidatus Schneideria nysicola]UAJ66137.1 CvpA family protein [Candidatus Schneideria nysicola]
MNVIDSLIIFIIIFFSIKSLIRGITQELLSLVSLLCALYISIYYYNDFSIYFNHFNDKFIQNGLASIFLFLSTMIIGITIYSLIKKIIDRAGLSSIDRIFGLFFGIAKGIFIISIGLCLIETFMDVSQNKEWIQSDLIPKFTRINRLNFYLFDRWIMFEK